jgi:hypothetical protein
VKRKLTWKERIAAARKAGRFTTEDYEQSVEFKTCALGEAIGARKSQSISNRYAFYRLTPAEHKLHDLAMAFCDAVEEDNLPGAARIYAQIRRATAAPVSK